MFPKAGIGIGAGSISSRKSIRSGDATHTGVIPHKLF